MRNVDYAPAITAKLARAKMTAVAVWAIYFLARLMLRDVHPCRTTSIAFGLFLGHHMAAYRATPKIFCRGHRLEKVARFSHHIFNPGTDISGTHVACTADALISNVQSSGRAA